MIRLGESMAGEKTTGRGVSAAPKATESASASAVPSRPADSEAPETRRETRRSKRVFITMPVTIRGMRGKDRFEEETVTETVNSYGCMIRLKTPVERGQKLTLVNVKSEEETECRVADVGQSDGRKFQVGLEFTTAAEFFWHIAFPPDDWNSADRKRATAGNPTPAPGKRS
jgi:hypothetical protein